MARMATLKQAAAATGLSEWELRMGARAGRYPHIRAGNSVTGKLLFDLDLLTDHIQEMMLAACQKTPELKTYGVLRKVKD